MLLVFFAMEGALLAHGQIDVHNEPNPSFSYQPADPECVLVPGEALPLVELHEVSVNPVLLPVEVILDVSTILWHISHSSQFGVICKLAEGTLCFLIQIINEQDWTQY